MAVQPGRSLPGPAGLRDWIGDWKHIRLDPGWRAGAAGITDTDPYYRDALQHRFEGRQVVLEELTSQLYGPDSL